MNEIEKLKTEHARYKKALETFSKTRCISLADTHRIANCALNPPAPVTLDELKNALSLFQANRALEYVSIQFHKDDSGAILDCRDRVLFSFTNFREAADFLTMGAA